MKEIILQESNFRCRENIYICRPLRRLRRLAVEYVNNVHNTSCPFCIAWEDISPFWLVRVGFLVSWGTCIFIMHAHISFILMSWADSAAVCTDFVPEAIHNQVAI